MQPLLLPLAFLLLPRTRAGKIIGGREARPHSHPYMAYLQIRSPGGSSFCGGFLVREDFVMTAAHCLGSNINVILGAHNVRRQERSQQRIPVLRAISHPAYNPQTNVNDIMLLQLGNRARLSREVRPVALPRTQARVARGTLCTLAGWGMVDLNRGTDTLRDVQLRVENDQECSVRFPLYTSQKQICVGDPRKRKSAFLGDSGAPRVQQRGPGDCLLRKQAWDSPAVFTWVSSFQTWIRRTMRRLQQQRQSGAPL